MGQIALRGYLSFAETVLDEARASRTPRDEIARILTKTLSAAASSARPESEND